MVSQNEYPLDAQKKSGELSFAAPKNINFVIEKGHFFTRRPVIRINISHAIDRCDIDVLLEDDN